MADSRSLPPDWVAVRFSALGDIALTTGVLDYWRRTRGWNFVVVTREAYAPLFEGHPAVREVVGLGEREMRLPDLLFRLRALADAYPNRGLLDLHGTLRTRLLAALWKGPVRRYDKMGLERRLHLAGRGIPFRERLLRLNVPQRYAAAVEEVPPPRSELLPLVRLSDAERTAADDVLARLPDMSAGAAPVALHPYATHPDKAWRSERWEAVAERLETARIPWFVIGRGTPIPGIDPARDLTGRTSLRETCALLGRAAVLVTGDSGPMHLACAVGTPVVALFGPTTRAWGFFPEGSRDRILEADVSCRPCALHGEKPCGRDHACMNGVSPEQVLRAVDELLSR